MADDQAFDKILELVGNDGKFQLFFNRVFNVGLVMCASMAYMNIMLALTPPDHNCHVPGIDKFNISVEKWRNLTLPIEADNRDIESYSKCRMYNISKVVHLHYDQWNFTKTDIIDCAYGYDYDKTFYDRTAVGDQNWVCDRELYQTNSFVFNRVGEVVGTFAFGQLGDILGRRPVFYISAATIIFGRIVSAFSASVYIIFAMASVVGMLTSQSIFMAPLIIAMETSKEEDRAKIAMFQCIGWTLGNCLMPLIFWWMRDWIWFLLLTTLPIGLFTIIPKYMIESPRWLATKRKFKECARELQKIADINGTDVKVTEKLLEEMMPGTVVEPVYGMPSLFSHWRLAKNTLLLMVIWIVACIVYFTLILNSTRMEGNPFLNFLWQSAIELPAYIIGKELGNRIGRRYTNAFAFTLAALSCIPITMIIKSPEHETAATALAVFIKFCISINFFVVNLQSMETYPTCLRQTGLSFGGIVGSSLGALGPYIVYLGTNFDARYPFYILGAMSLAGGVSAMFLPETLHQKLPNTMRDAHVFGKDQTFWHIPKKPKVSDLDDEAMTKLNPENHS